MNLSETEYLAPTLDPAARVLLDAADYMTAHGKSSAGFLTLAKCALLTINAVGNGDAAAEAQERLRAICQAEGFVDISDYNDRHTAAEVIATLRRAAEG